MLKTPTLESFHKKVNFNKKNTDLTLAQKLKFFCFPTFSIVFYNFTLSDLGDLYHKVCSQLTRL